MGVCTRDDVREYVTAHIQSFHTARLESLSKLRLSTIVQRKNPYLFRAKNMISGPELVKAFLDAHLSSQEEGLFGTFLEGLARFVCEQIDNGHKSSAKGIDLEFKRDQTTYIITIKSGPNWGNSGQLEKMVDHFRLAKKILGTNLKGQHVVAINGCCYGKEAKPDKGDYLKLCGQEFWTFLTGDPLFYIDVVDPIGYQAKQQNEAFAIEYAKVITRFTEQFIADFCEDGLIVWDRILVLNSAKPVPKA